MPESIDTPPHPFAELIGFSLTERGEGQCVSELQIQPRHMNPNGVVHGAVVYALIDTGMGGALTSLLDDTQICSTIEIKVNYLRPAVSGKLFCRTRVLNKGRRTSVLESQVLDDQDRLVSIALGTFMIIDAPVTR